MEVGIDAIHCYLGRAYVVVDELCEYRQFKLDILNSIGIKQKTIRMPFEDVVTFAVNAALPLLKQLSAAEIKNIKQLIIATESGLSINQSIAKHIHHYLKLPKDCNYVEIKQACYGSTAALQMALQYCATHRQNDKILVIASDVTHQMLSRSPAELSQAAGAVAILVSQKPRLVSIDLDQSAYITSEIMDTCRPADAVETGDPNLPLLSYIENFSLTLNQLKKSFTDIDYLACHTPLPTMPKAALRLYLRSEGVSKERSLVILNEKLKPALCFAELIGNVYSPSLYISLISLLCNVDEVTNKKIGLYAYGSGFMAEFYLGTTTNNKHALSTLKHMQSHLGIREKVTLHDYELILDHLSKRAFSNEIFLRTASLNIQQLYDEQFRQRNLLVLNKIEENHREYIWA